MARSKGLRNKVKDLVFWGHKNGLWQSLIINTGVLLVLALTFVSIDRKEIPISLSFSTPEEIQDIDFSQPEPIQVDIAGDINESFVDNSYLIDTPANEILGQKNMLKTLGASHLGEEAEETVMVLVEVVKVLKR